ncbi:MAG: ABC transporter permease, partial [Thermodesulfobacteriota bacterium]|nr:ABC transporter permease [Thermodesulfobacteriota bacterium]
MPVLNVLRILSRTLPIALGAIWAYRLRSAFTACAVGLGIAALTVIVTAVDGAQRKAHEIVDMFGPEAAFVLGGDIRSRAVGKRTYTLTWEDARHIRESLPGAYLVVPLRAKRNVPIRAGAKNMVVPVVVGTTADYTRVWNWPLSEGRDISAKDVELSAKVGLIGDSVARELFGDRSPIGRTVFVKDFTVQIIGRLMYRGFSGGGGAVDERIIIPLTTLTKRFNMDRKYFRALRVKFHHPEYMDTHTENLRSLLRRLHGLKQGQDDDFTILTADEILKFISMLKGGLVLFLGITAAVGM